MSPIITRIIFTRQLAFCLNELWFDLLRASRIWAYLSYHLIPAFRTPKRKEVANIIPIVVLLVKNTVRAASGALGPRDGIATSHI